MEQKVTIDIDKPAFYTVTEVAVFMRVSTKTILRAIKKGKINAFSIGTRTKKLYRIPASEINRVALFDLQQMVEKMVEERTSTLK